MIYEPRESAANREGRDELGRFLPGCPPGPGRPPVPDFRKVVAERLAANGGSVDAVLFEVFEALRVEAVAGNVAAARLLLDRLAPSQEDTDRGQTLGDVLARVAMRNELDTRPVLNVVTGVVPADSEGSP